MKTTKLTIIASGVLLALQGCATAPEEHGTLAPDFSKSLPPTAAGVPAVPQYFSSAQEAAKALAGYNYGLVNLPDGRVQAFVSGLVGSGSDNPLTAVQARAPSGQSLLADLSAEDTQTPFPQITLKEKKNGQAAIDALGDKLDEVAKSYGMTPERLQEILRTDSTAWVDENGRLLYIDSHTQALAEPPREEATATVTGSVLGATTESTDPFALHSKPGSSRVIYLDFNGHVATNTAWSAQTLTAAPYDIDGNPAAFSVTEQNNIREIWQRVAEDYAPFDVDVTTQEPDLAALQRTSSSDIQYGTRAVITRSMPELCSQSCGGVAYVNVFSYYSSTTPDRYQPAWAFFDKLGNGYPKYVAEAVSHEVGHNLNLNHDGNASTGYYSGHGSGATGWAPVMGVGYYQPVVQWSKGEYPGANNLQDDIAVIHAAGAALRGDDYADTVAAASSLGGSAAAVDQAGIIERNTDVDVFAFTAGVGVAQFTVTPGPVAPNLDVLLKVLDAQGNTIAQSNPVDDLTASINVTLPAGPYFLQVEGVGKGDLSTGYSDYGSVGKYQIAGSFGQPVTTVLVPPSAALSASPVLGDAPLSVTFNGSNSRDSDGSIVAYQWNFGDGTSASAGATTSHVYQTVGTFTATLTVTDNSGLSASATQTIQATKAPVSTGMKSGSTKVTRKISASKLQCVATVAVQYGSEPVGSATVYGYWSGSASAGKKQVIYKATGRSVTSKSGLASFTSPAVPSKSQGTCAFTVTNVTKKGYNYDGNGAVAASLTW